MGASVPGGTLCPRKLFRGALLLIAVLMTGVWNPAAGWAQEAAERTLFEHADELQRSGDAEGALAEYLLLAQQFPSGELAGEALVRAAFMARDLGDLSQAATLAERVTREHPRTGSAAGAEVVSAMVARSRATDLSTLVELRDRLARVALLFPPSDFPATPWRAAANTLAGELSLELGEAVLATGLFEAATRDTADDEWLHRARLGVARGLTSDQMATEVGAVATAARFLQATIDEAPGTPAAERARRMLGLIHRLRLRPSAGSSPWASSRMLRNVGGALDRPIGVATDAGGTLMVADEGSRQVAAVDWQGAPLWRQQPMNSDAHPWFDRFGVPFIQTGSAVVQLAQRVRVTFTYPDRGNERPVEKIRAGAQTLFGDLVLAHDDGKVVSLFAPGGVHRRSLTANDRIEVVDIAVDATGQLYLLDERASAVRRYSAEAIPTGRAASRDWDRPESIAVDPFGNLYVLDRDQRRIDVMAPDGRLIASVGRGLPGGNQLDDPRDLAVDDSGRLYIADRGLEAIVVLE